jgi:hypothetical protein
MSSVPMPKALVQPRTIDRYQLKAIIGQGGMGLVYRACDGIVSPRCGSQTIQGSRSRSRPASRHR